MRNLAAFNAAHPGFAGTIVGVYSGSLDNSGEQVRLEDAVGTTILDFNYKDGWYNITDGGGLSLTLLDSSNADLTSWSDKDSWTSSSVLGGTPGQADTGPHRFFDYIKHQSLLRVLTSIFQSTPWQGCFSGSPWCPHKFP